MLEVLVKDIPDYKQFGRAARLRLNPNNIEDLGCEIPTHIQTQPMLPDTKVSEVSSVAPELMSQDTTTSQGESFKTTEPNTWFQSMTDHFRSMSHCWLHQHYLPLCQSTLVNT